MEDIYNRNIYRAAFLDEFGVDPKATLVGKPKSKWSNTMERRFRDAGKPWSDGVKASVKNWLADFASQRPGEIVQPELEAPLLNFIKSVEGRLPD
jgi:hypothetical protein